MRSGAASQMGELRERRLNAPALIGSDQGSNQRGSAAQAELTAAEARISMRPRRWRSRGSRPTHKPRSPRCRRRQPARPPQPRRTSTTQTRHTPRSSL